MEYVSNSIIFIPSHIEKIMTAKGIKKEWFGLIANYSNEINKNFNSTLENTYNSTEIKIRENSQTYHFVNELLNLLEGKLSNLDVSDFINTNKRFINLEVNHLDLSQEVEGIRYNRHMFKEEYIKSFNDMLNIYKSNITIDETNLEKTFKIEVINNVMVVTLLEGFSNMFIFERSDMKILFLKLLLEKAFSIFGISVLNTNLFRSYFNLRLK